MFPVKASADSRYKKKLSLQIQDDDADSPHGHYEQIILEDSPHVLFDMVFE
jgi:hypothetical protein